MENMRNFGFGRVIEPKGFIPIAAWKLDNSLKIKKTEMRIRVQSIKFEEGNFRQLCNVCGYEENKIKSRVLDIVKKRGKLHNPSTDSGGICYGIVDEIGEDYKNHENLQVGDAIICLTSLTSLPLYLEKLGNINFNYGQIEVEGYAILFETSPVILAPKDVNRSCALYAFDESGSVAKAYHMAEKGKRFLLLGSGLLSILIYSAAIRKSAGKDCRIVAVLDKESMASLCEDDINEVLKKYVDKVYVADILASLQTYELIRKKEFNDTEELFDVSINCANLLGVETISVLLTKEHGILFFTNLINNYNMVLLFAESLGKNINIISLEEYSQDFPRFTIELMRSLKNELNQINHIYNKYDVISRLPVRVTELIQYNNVKKMDGYIFASETTRKMLEDVLNIASYDCSVIIQGETGAGKEKVLELLHKNSKRNMNVCIKINCATIQANLAESEFFGYEAGSFTGASSLGKQGYFELANNGILFLDEVGELPLALQSKLLRVLQENQFYRVGGQVPVQVNVRVICASNLSLRALVKEGKFREDLYYRLNICEINIPPLQERKEDIVCLAEYFLERYNEKYMQNKKLSEEALLEMNNYQWPGNVRELDNTVHRAVVNCKNAVIGGEDIYNAINSNLYGTEEKTEAKENKLSEANARNMTLNAILDNHEKAIIEEVLHNEGTTRKAAQVLGISQSQLMRKKAKYNL
ncbi:MAG: hypothetical protein E7222_11065 [Clostridiales bacterium]|nr:hypothetical protein [Clostridiales bacterium]